MDIGCYPIPFRDLFWTGTHSCPRTPRTRPGDGHRSADLGILEFPDGQSVFTCSTQMVPYQRTQILGTLGALR